MAKKDKVVEESRPLVIKPPKFQYAGFHIVGTAPYVQNRFSEKAAQMMRDKQTKGSQAKKGAAREGKDFQMCYEQAKHISKEGWCGIPASAFRAAMISACRLVAGKARLGEERSGETRSGKAGMVCQDASWHGKMRSGETRQARRVLVRRNEAWLVTAGVVGQG
jgi:hypothetical protein